MKKLSQVLKLHISGMLETILLKFGMWSTEVGGNVHSKNRLVSQGSTELRIYGGAKIAFSFFLSIYSLVLHASFLGHTTHYCVC